MASIQRRELASGEVSFRVMFRLDGRLCSDSFADPRAAQRYKDLVERLGGEAARATLDAHGGSAGNVPTLAVWLEHYLEHLTGVSAGTVAEYRRLAARTWLPSLGEYPVDVITRDRVRQWVGEQAHTLTKRGTPTSAKTLANAHGLLSACIAGAVEAGHRPDNPCRGVALPSGERDEMVVLTHAEFARLVHALPAHWHPLVLTLAGTGMRWSEATALQWAEVDLDADAPYLRVRRAWKRGAQGARLLGSPKTARSRRTIHLPPEVVDLLRPLRRRPSDWVFTAARGGVVHHQAWLPRVWHPAVRKAGLGKSPTPHDLRHSHASWLLSAGVPVLEVQRRLGHESAKTTLDVYGHLVAGASDRAILAASLALTSAMPALEG